MSTFYSVIFLLNYLCAARGNPELVKESNTDRNNLSNQHAHRVHDNTHRINNGAKDHVKAKSRPSPEERGQSWSPQASNQTDSVWTEWRDLPNPLLANWFLSLRHASYKDGVLNIHLPENTSKSVRDIVSVHNIRIVHTPLDLTTCTSTEKRSVTYTFPCDGRNCFATNAGHLTINVLNPLFIYLFFVRNELLNLRNESNIPDKQLPLPNTLLLISTGKGQKSFNPVFLYDVVLRFASDQMNFADYFGALHGTHCFDRIDVPLQDVLADPFPDPNAPKPKPKPAYEYGLWDTMHYSHKGRWGMDDFYFNFWRNVKKQILQLYDIPVHKYIYGQSRSQVYGADGFKPKLVFAYRYGSGSRADRNINLVEEVLRQYFHVVILTSGYYTWHAHDASLRYKLTRETLIEIQSADIMMGQAGSNNQLALFMQEQKIVVELASFGYCCNEGAKALANHNHLAFYKAKGNHVAKADRGGVTYDRGLLTKLSQELILAWNDERAGELSESRRDDWRSECDFLWPHHDPLIVAQQRILTRSNQSRCYLELVPTKGWYQVAMHKNYMWSECMNDDVPYGTVVLKCMRSGLC